MPGSPAKASAPRIPRISEGIAVTAGFEAPQEGSGALAQITRGVVHLHAEHFGRGPTRARSDFIGGDGVICVLRDTLTAVELTLVERGRSGEVRALRRAFQDAMAPEFRALVEEAVGRRVVAFLSEMSLAPDIAVDLFFLEPATPGTS